MKEVVAGSHPETLAESPGLPAPPRQILRPKFSIPRLVLTKKATKCLWEIHEMQKAPYR
jgi:hypothetical protein